MQARAKLTAARNQALASAGAAKLRLANVMQDSALRKWSVQNSGLAKFCAWLAAIAVLSATGSWLLRNVSPWLQSALLDVAFLCVSAIFTVGIVDEIVARNERAKSVGLEKLLLAQARRVAARIDLVYAVSFRVEREFPPVPKSGQSLEEVGREMQRRQADYEKRMITAVDHAWNSGSYAWWQLFKEFDSILDRAHRIVVASRGVIPNDVELPLQSIVDAMDYLIESRFYIDYAMMMPPELRAEEWSQREGQPYVTALRRILDCAHEIESRTPVPLPPMPLLPELVQALAASRRRRRWWDRWRRQPGRPSAPADPIGGAFDVD